jgi:CheY-like chemotaxis protein
VTLGYRLEAGGMSVVYSSDHEPHSRHQAEPGAPRHGELPTLVHVEDERHAEFLRDADLVIHDAQYTAAEYGKKIGWGHSTVEYVVDMAIAASVKRLALFHHDPLRNDAAVDALLEACQERARAWGSNLEIVAAAEGAEHEFVEGTARRRIEGAASATQAPVGRLKAVTVLVVEDDSEIVGLVKTALEGEDYRFLSAGDGREGLEVARSERPDLVLLNWGLPEMDGLAVVRALRADPDPSIRQMPVVMLTWRSGSDETREGFEAGADDFITKPFSPAQVRTRVREWLTRSNVATQ